MHKLKITQIGNSLGVILNKEILAKLRAGKGDFLFAVETPNGVSLTLEDDAFSSQMEAAEYVMRKHRDVLRKLAE
jgi:putative addiction module antidote